MASFYVETEIHKTRFFFMPEYLRDECMSSLLLLFFPFKRTCYNNIYYRRFAWFLEIDVAGGILNLSPDWEYYE